MILNNKTLPKIARNGSDKPTIGVYGNSLRFGKATSAMMKLPRPIAFVCEENLLAAMPDPENGFTPIFNKKNGDYVINRSGLAHHLLKHFKASKSITFEVVDQGNDKFELKLFKHK